MWADFPSSEGWLGRQVHRAAGMASLRIPGCKVRATSRAGRWVVGARAERKSVPYTPQLSMFTYCLMLRVKWRIAISLWSPASTTDE